jgi:hypothetical protein
MQGAVRREWHVIYNGCNAGLWIIWGGLRANCEAVAHVVASLGKDSPLPAKRA